MRSKKIRKKQTRKLYGGEQLNPIFFRPDLQRYVSPNTRNEQARLAEEQRIIRTEQEERANIARQHRILAEQAAAKARKKKAIQNEKEKGYLIPRRGRGIKSKNNHKNKTKNKTKNKIKK
jgi:hypothetical protein